MRCEGVAQGMGRRWLGDAGTFHGALQCTLEGLVEQ
jgi:hypothetical protein